jgi:hypothetical protein
MMGRLPLLCLRRFDDTDAIGADKSVHTYTPSGYASPMHVHGNQAEQKKESLIVIKARTPSPVLASSTKIHICSLIPIPRRGKIKVSGFHRALSLTKRKLRKKPLFPLHKRRVLW